MTRLFGARPSDTRSLAGAAIALPAPASEVDQRRWCTYVDDQIGDRCVGDSIKGAHWMAVGGVGSKADSRGIYVNARVRERARKGDAIPDVGCMPDDAYSSLVAVGIFAADSREWDASAQNAMNTVEEIVGEKKFTLDDFATIDDGDLDTLKAWLTLGAARPDGGIGVTFCMQVDASYEQLGAGGVWNGMQGPSLGGHQEVCVGYTTKNGVPCAIVWNTYGAGWGDGGFSYIPLAKFAEIATEMVAVKGGPVLP